MARDQAYASRPGLDVDLTEGVLRLRLDRPDKRNAVDDEMMAGLVDSVSTAEEDEAVRVIVIDGAGEHFCAGADIVARNEGDDRPRVGSIQRRVPHTAHRLVALVASVQVPVVCAVRGWAAGLGFQLALAADFTLAATDARFWEPFVDRGFTPDSGATWMLQRRVGPVRARDLLLLGRKLSGTEAAEWGAIHGAHPAAALDGEVAALVGATGRRGDGGPRVDQVAAARRGGVRARRVDASRGLRPRAVVPQRGLPRGLRRLPGQAGPRVPRSVSGAADKRADQAGTPMSRQAKSHRR